MISLRRKYLIQKLCWGIILLLSGFREKIEGSIRQLVGNNKFSNSIIPGMFNILIIISILVFVITLLKKSEVKDELADSNIKLSQSFIFNLLMTVALIYCLIQNMGLNIKLTLDPHLIFIIFGICSILEYFLFMLLDGFGTSNE